jgi:Xaa-Pro aminopeptidase
MIRAKIEQAFEVLKEQNVDLWIVYCRESEDMTDPSLDLVVGEHVVAKGMFFFLKTGEALALVWKHDADNFTKDGNFDIVITYTTDFNDKVKEIIGNIKPQNIALNYSIHSNTADGISYGLFLNLQEILSDTPYHNRFISAEDLLLKIRSIKTEQEIEKLAYAAKITDRCWHDGLKEIKTGMSEIEIAGILEAQINHYGGSLSFPVIVNAGAKTSPGHGLPTSAVLEPGDLLHVDFGAKVEGYCADIQRLAYFKKSEENDAPEVLKRGFETVKKAIDNAIPSYKTGELGVDIDTAARKVLTDAGYPEYQHSLGHQIGRLVHDGGSRVGPVYEVSDFTAKIPLVAGNTFTVELGVSIENIGYVGLEEDILVTDNGGRLLANRQDQLIII